MRRKITKPQKRGTAIATAIAVGVIALSRILRPVATMLPPTYRTAFGVGMIMFVLAAAPLLLLWLTSKDNDA
jgi:hypothetical protein